MKREKNGIAHAQNVCAILICAKRFILIWYDFHFFFAQHVSHIFFSACSFCSACKFLDLQHIFNLSNFMENKWVVRREKQSCYKSA